MLALGIEFLTGRYVATAYNDRRRAEWPPHPARVFSALVATHFEDPDRDARERDALLWLERQAPPEIHGTEAHPRDIFDVFVPVNDGGVVADAWDELAEVDAARRAVAEASGAKEAAKAEKALAKAEVRLGNKVAKSIAVIDGDIPAEASKQATALLPERRGKQPRTFPAVIPEVPRVTLVWPTAEANDELRAVIDRLVARVVRLGHSSSLVSMRILSDDQIVRQPLCTPDPDGDQVLRGVEAGQLDRLCEDFARHRGTEPRVLPAAEHLYARPRPPRTTTPTSVFGDDWIVLATTERRRFAASRGVDIARAVRAALQKHSPQQPAPEVISGHRSPGAPSERPHLAIVPLPHVGFRGADGDLRGVALILPREASAAERQAVREAVAAWERSERTVARQVLVLLPGGIELRLERQTVTELAALTPSRWSRPAREWATVTPIALDRHPGDLLAREPAQLAKAVGEARTTIVEACHRIGLPTPHVELQQAAPIAGAGKVRGFPAYPPVAGRTRRALTHAVLTFAQPVGGPLLLGAGRYHGLGLLVPCDGE